MGYKLYSGQKSWDGIKLYHDDSTGYISKENLAREYPEEVCGR
ncbi:unnamed protein product, partial [marine sediment metagenome]